MANNDWTQKEVELIVADYFEMLQSELEDKDYNKTAHRTALLQVIKRSEASIEFKHRNISAVLINMGLPYIRGYKPLFNYQKQLLEIQVSNYLNNSQAAFEKDFENFADTKVSTTVNYQSYFDYIIDNDLPTGSNIPDDEPIFRPMKINYLEREQNNRRLGLNGEELVINYEKWRLNNAGKENLVDQIEWVSRDKGDGTGYDILTKNVDGSDRFIEVKTTKLSKETPIYLTKTEIHFASLNSDKFHLYRVFNFDIKPQFFIRNGSYESYCKLQPLTFKGYF